LSCPPPAPRDSSSRRGTPLAQRWLGGRGSKSRARTDSCRPQSCQLTGTRPPSTPCTRLRLRRWKTCPRGTAFERWRPRGRSAPRRRCPCMRSWRGPSPSHRSPRGTGGARASLWGSTSPSGMGRCRRSSASPQQRHRCPRGRGLWCPSPAPQGSRSQGGKQPAPYWQPLRRKRSPRRTDLPSPRCWPKRGTRPLHKRRTSPRQPR